MEEKEQKVKSEMQVIQSWADCMFEHEKYCIIPI